MVEMQSNESGLIAAYKRIVGDRWDPLYVRTLQECGNAIAQIVTSEVYSAIDAAIFGLGSTSTDEI